jgi:CheY-like chemotaxis protein
MAPISDLKGLRIMVVDDQKFLRSMVAQGLKGAGAEVIEAADGFAGLGIIGLGADSGSTLDKLKAKRPDMFDGANQIHRSVNCIVTDIRMAPMNGLEMLKAIRSGLSKAPREIPVIIMSAHTDESLIGAAVALDAHGFVSKPVSQKAIADRILRAMRASFKPKPAEVYQTLIIPELDEAILETDVSFLSNDMLSKIRAGDVNSLTGERSSSVNWADLAIGDIIAADFKTQSGQLVVPAGTTVTSVLLNALGDLSQVSPLADSVHIRRKVL